MLSKGYFCKGMTFQISFGLVVFLKFCLIVCFVFFKQFFVVVLSFFVVTNLLLFFAVFSSFLLANATVHMVSKGYSCKGRNFPNTPQSANSLAFFSMLFLGFWQAFGVIRQVFLANLRGKLQNYAENLGKTYEQPRKALNYSPIRV